MKGEHVAHKVAALAQIHVYELAYNLVVGHLYLGGKAGEKIFVFGCIAYVAGAVGGRFYGEVFKVIVFAELASLGFEAFGSHHIVVGDGVLYVEDRWPRMQGESYACGYYRQYWFLHVDMLQSFHCSLEIESPQHAERRPVAVYIRQYGRRHVY